MSLTPGMRAKIAAGAAFSAASGVKLLAGRAPTDDADQYEHNFGWTHPMMELHWHRFRSKEPFGHVAKNLITEWTRLMPQRAAKTFCALIFLGFLSGFVLATVIL